MFGCPGPTSALRFQKRLPVLASNPLTICPSQRCEEIFAKCERQATKRKSGRRRLVPHLDGVGDKLRLGVDEPPRSDIADPEGTRVRGPALIEGHAVNRCGGARYLGAEVPRVLGEGGSGRARHAQQRKGSRQASEPTNQSPQVCKPPC